MKIPSTGSDRKKKINQQGRLIMLKQVTADMRRQQEAQAEVHRRPRQGDIFQLRLSEETSKNLKTASPQCGLPILFSIITNLLVLYKIQMMRRNIFNAFICPLKSLKAGPNQKYG